MADRHSTGRSAPTGRRRRVGVLLGVLALLATLAPATVAGADPATPAITVTPSTMLLDRQLVTVSGTGFPAGATVYIVQCLTGQGVDGCNLGVQVSVVADGSGAFSSGFPVRRILRVGGTATDCADAGACIIGAGVPPDGSAGAANAPIQFDGSQPLPPPPVISASPNTDLVDRQTVLVTGSGFPTGETAGVIQCVAGATDSSGCLFSTLVYAPADGTGHIEVSMRVRRFITLPSGTTDCALPGACAIGAAPLSEQDNGATTPIVFDPDAPLPPPPVATVDPSTGLTDGQRVAVTGSGFEPDSGIAVIQCAVGGPGDGSACDLSSLTYAPSDAQGNVRASFTVRASLHTSGGTVDCAAAPGTCMVAVVWPGDPSSAVVTPLSFATAGGGGTAGGGTGGATPVMVAPRFTG